jgi:hypothetical protein
MYGQMNISTSEAGKPEGVLIRAVEPVLDTGKFKIQKQPFGESAPRQQNSKFPKWRFLLKNTNFGKRDNNFLGNNNFYFNFLPKVCCYVATDFGKERE